jgi:hypothetical protein
MLFVSFLLVNPMQDPKTTILFWTSSFARSFSFYNGVLSFTTHLDPSLIQIDNLMSPKPVFCRKDVGISYLSLRKSIEISAVPQMQNLSLDRIFWIFISHHCA